jgi:hypothetical protein
MKFSINDENLHIDYLNYYVLTIDYFKKLDRKWYISPANYLSCDEYGFIIMGEDYE